MILQLDLKMGMFGCSQFLECSSRIRQDFPKSKSGLFLGWAGPLGHPGDLQCPQMLGSGTVPEVVQQQRGRVGWRSEVLVLALMALSSVMATVGA